MRIKKDLAFLVTAGAMAALATMALATPGSNVVGTVMARAGFVDSVDLRLRVTSLSPGHRHKKDREVIRVDDAADTVMQKIVIGPGGSTGWHSHPGPAIALVTNGELTLYSSDDPACTDRAFGAGQAFVDSGQGHVHNARNLTSQNTEVWVTYLDVPPGGSVRIDAADPGNCVF
ncbi:MAG TPA: cupin domain-containing protein [Vicinamibacterales bacterium]|nr:cupin domain-containing protein [Vicinamibacterales bacterium]